MENLYRRPRVSMGERRIGLLVISAACALYIAQLAVPLPLAVLDSPSSSQDRDSKAQLALRPVMHTKNATNVVTTLPSAQSVEPAATTEANVLQNQQQAQAEAQAEAQAKAEANAALAIRKSETTTSPTNIDVAPVALMDMAKEPSKFHLPMTQSSSLSQQPNASLSPEESLLQLTNAERAKRGLSPLQTDANLTAMAREWAVHLADIHTLVHRSEAGKEATPSKGRLAEFTMFGENLYKSARPGNTGIPINGWMKSDPHRENQLQPAFERVGFGIAKAPDGTVWIVAEYGSTRPSSTLSTSMPPREPMVTQRTDGVPM